MLKFILYMDAKRFIVIATLLAGIYFVLTNSCNQKPVVTSTIISAQQKHNFFLGFWQNTENPHHFISFFYALNDLEKGLGGWGSFPLEADSLHPDLVDTSAYYRNFVFVGGYQIEQDKISCWYASMDEQEKRISGEIKITGDSTISTPVGNFRKLSNEELHRINPYL